MRDNGFALWDIDNDAFGPSLSHIIVFSNNLIQKGKDVYKKLIIF